jgi:hypothetical protein
MPCNASYARFISGKFFTSTIILYVLLFAQNFYSCKKWVLQRSTGEESSTRVLPDLSLFNITLTPTLKGEIISAQKNDAGMAHIKRRIQEGDPKLACFRKDTEGTLWFKDRLVVPKKRSTQKEDSR